jgi:hypothetical protein
MFARRFCAIGAVIRAGRELFLPTGNACMALQSQAGRPVESRNDDAKRTNAEILAGFDAAILALRRTTI